MSPLGRLARTLRRTLAVAQKELRQLGRDRLSIGLVVGVPTLQLVLFGFAINMDVRNVPTAPPITSAITQAASAVASVQPSPETR